jgi:hypothetical protein
VRYFVYRDTDSPVAPTAENLIAAGVLGTSFTDTADLANGQIRHYLVRAQEASTGMFDANTVEASAFADGPGSGPQAVLDADFEDPASLADWTVTTGPNPHTCGEWALSTNSASRPSGGSGSYVIANNECHPILGRTSSTLISPAIDVDTNNLVDVTLEFDMWFNHDGNETAKVEVFDGSDWIALWEDSNSDLNGHQSYDVTACAVGNPDFSVRFDYQFATEDKWFSVDNVRVIALYDVQCSTTPAGPAAAPDGSGFTSPLTGERLAIGGDTIGLTWDAGSCPAAEYNLLYGDLASVSTLTLSGSECSLGTGGGFTWNDVPAGSLFFIVVSDDAVGTEGSWGRDGYGGERNAYTPSGECGVSYKETSNSCP